MTYLGSLAKPSWERIADFPPHRQQFSSLALLKRAQVFEA